MHNIRGATSVFKALQAEYALLNSQFLTFTAWSDLMLHRPTHRLFLPLLLAFLVAGVPVQAFQAFTNYRSAIDVRSILIENEELWAATSGGLFHMSLDGNGKVLENDTRRFPDLRLTALVRDNRGTLWMGTRSGYLYSRNSLGTQEVHNAYYAADWGINCLFAYENYLIVGSTAGVSVFGLNEGKAIQNASRIGDLGNSNVNTILVHRGVLYVGFDVGYATLNVASQSIVDYNFFDNTIWTTVATTDPVRSFVVSGSTVSPSRHVTSSTGPTYYADSTTIFKDTSAVVEFLTEINTFVFDKNGVGWIGTRTGMLYRLVGNDTAQIVMPGLTFTGVDRIHVAKDGVVWLLPSLSIDQWRAAAGFGYKVPWYQKVTTFDGENWKQENAGYLGSGNQPYCHGFCEDRNGDIWLATFGYDNKYYDSRNKKWHQWVYGASRASMAIAQDSSGVIWFGNSYAENSASLIGVRQKVRGDVESMDTTFWLADERYALENIYSIHVDPAGRVFLGGFTGSLVHFTHNGQVFEQGENAIVTIERESQNLAVIPAMVSTPDTTTWLATGKGLYRFDPYTSSLQAFGSVSQSITSIAVESEDILWLGTADKGLIRLSLLDSAQTVYDKSDGLISNMVTDISLDLDKGKLWIGTTDGASRMDLGHQFEIVTDNAHVEAYPNPYSFTKNDGITFRNITSSSRLFIVDVDGKIVAEVDPTAKNSYGWIFQWKPSASISPGIYFYAIRSPGKGAIGKILLVP